MINLIFRISNPWSDRFKSFGSVDRLVTKHTAVELEHYFHSGTLFELLFSYSTRGDHAGLNISFCLLGYAVGFITYDIRHWDYENNCWEENEQS